MSEHEAINRPPARKPPSKLGCYLAPVVLVLMGLTFVAIRERQATADFERQSRHILSKIVQSELNAGQARTLDQWRATRKQNGLSDSVPDKAITASGGSFDDESGLIGYQRLVVRLPDAKTPSRAKETTVDVAVVMLRPWLASSAEFFLIDSGVKTAAQDATLERLRIRLRAERLEFTERVLPDFDPKTIWQRIRDAALPD